MVKFPAPKVATQELETAKFGVIVPPADCAPQEVAVSGVTACPAPQALLPLRRGTVAPLVPVLAVQALPALERSPQAMACVPPSETECPAMVIEELARPLFASEPFVTWLSPVTCEHAALMSPEH
jgi:hypothetical protein